jgi:hypothetical protein
MKHFDILILIARPAAGKSEVIKYLSELAADTRKKEFHLGDLVVLDDFPMLWRWFEEDALLAKMGMARLYTDENGYFTDNSYWHLLIRLIDLDYKKLVTKEPAFHEKGSVIIEFSRGSEHGGYREALAQIPAEMLARASILYVSVPFEESYRKNRRRYNPENADSILEHSVPDEKMQKLYAEDDWQVLTKDSPGFLTVNGVQVPYVTFENSDDVTTRGGKELEVRLKDAIDQLWSRKCDHPSATIHSQ